LNRKEKRDKMAPSAETLDEKNFNESLQFSQKVLKTGASLAVVAIGFVLGLLDSIGVDTDDQVEAILLIVTSSLGAFVVFLQSLEKLDNVGLKVVNHTTVCKLLDPLWTLTPGQTEPNAALAVRCGRLWMEIRMVLVGLVNLAIAVIGSATKDPAVIKGCARNWLLFASSILALFVPVIEWLEKLPVTCIFTPPMSTNMLAQRVAQHTSDLYHLRAQAAVAAAATAAAATATAAAATAAAAGFAAPPASMMTMADEKKRLAQKLEYAGRFV
jgi:hypothetical protein